RLWQELGIGKESIIIENQSTNTYEYARETSKLLVVKERWLLVTSAVHMKRAVESFREVGMKVDPIPVDYLFSMSPSIFDFSLFDSLNLWRTISHEYFGIIYYRWIKWL
ncbi:MAG: YdcF family protein, partial [Actinobacteria bacterium]|nr:YdcF family protein [Actinomycetota bacterium]